jgi:anti-sigma regulatory factor (Ser/Thr protein kinase)
MPAMYESLAITTKGGKEAPARVRAALTGLNGELGEKSEDVRLLVSELVTNAVVHSDLDHRRFLRIEVSVPPERITGALEYPGEPFTAGPDAEGDRLGLHLVESLSDSWGFERAGDKNRVWFEISR